MQHQQRQTTDKIGHAKKVTLKLIPQFSEQNNTTSIMLFIHGLSEVATRAKLLDDGIVFLQLHV